MPLSKDQREKRKLIVEECISRVKAGEFKKKLANEYGVAIATIYEWTKGIPQEGRIHTMLSHYHPIEIKSEAIRRVKNGEKKDIVAKDMGLNKSTVAGWTIGIVDNPSAMNPNRKPHSILIQKEVIRRVIAGETKRSVGKNLGVGKNTVNEWTKDILRKKTYPKAIKEEAIRRVESGEKKVDVAKALKIGITTLNTLTSHVKICRPYPKEIKVEVIRRVKAGEMRSDLAREFGLNNTTVGKWVRNLPLPEKIPAGIKSDFILRINKGESVAGLLRETGLGWKIYHRWRKNGLFEIELSEENRVMILEELKTKKLIDVANKFSVPMPQIRSLKLESIGVEKGRTFSKEEISNSISLVIKGGSIRAIAAKLNCSVSTVNSWYRQAVSDGVAPPLKSIRKSKVDDLDFEWIARYFPEVIDWQLTMSTWLKGESRSIGFKIEALYKFISAYLILPEVPKTRIELLKKGKLLPDLKSIVIQSGFSSDSAVRYNNVVCALIDWVLLADFSVHDDNDFQLVPPEFYNPFRMLKRAPQYGKPQQSVRDVLPYGYIIDLREKLAQGKHFSDWTFAQSAIGFDTVASKNSQTDWFEVTEDRLDKSDPNCVWRIRRRLILPPILEMWSPVRWVAVLHKLQTVARTGMTRFVDSGESDSLRYEAGKFVENLNPLAKQNGKSVWRQGIFRQVFTASGESQAILYYNTNKTKDAAKSGKDKGHECPWPSTELIHEDPYYWLEQLRNWQEKYNPITQRTSWLQIPAHRALSPKSEIQKAGYLDTCFLFRTPEFPGEEHLPVSNGQVDGAWRALLSAFDVDLATRGVTLADGSPVRLSGTKEYRTRFPLHGLRVSLITAMIIDGKVDPALMMKIVGHERLIMTLYYTKPGFSHLRNALTSAAQKLDQQKESSILRFLSNADNDELLDHIVFNTDDWKTVIAANPLHRNPVGWLQMHDGICFAGGNTSPLDGDAKAPGCHNGGPLIKASTNEYSAVPGGVMNCSRCRWKAAEKHHGPGLVATLNNLSYRLHQEQESAVKFFKETTLLKKQKARTEADGLIFTDMNNLRAAERRYEAAMIRMSELASSVAAQYKMIQRVIELPDITGNGVALVAAGDAVTMHAVFDDTNSELLQLSGICGDVEIYPDLNSGKAIFRRSQLLDAALVREGEKPYFAELNEDEQLMFGNAFMRKLAHQANSSNHLIGLNDIVQAIDAGESLEAILGINVSYFLSVKSEEYSNLDPIRIENGNKNA